MIRIENVTFRYACNEKPTLNDFSLEIPRGQCILLCGESGSGKTTVSRLINGLIPNYFEGEMTGSVHVGELDVTGAELYETARAVGSVFQNPRSQFFCVDTTSEIAFGCENMGLPENEILKRMDSVRKDLKLDRLMDRNIFELSGGEKQKIACASVSALDPDVYVLDEPTSNLDVDAIQDMKNTVRLWKSRGKTVVIAEHRLYWLADICDRVVYVKDGRIGFDMSMDEFRNLCDEELWSYGLRSLHLHVDGRRDVDCHSERSFTLHDFSFFYDAWEAIHIPELTLPLDGIIAVIGNNGAGKSTFSKCLCGTEKRFRGYAEIDGRKLRRKALMKRSYLVMQDVNHQLFSETVEEEVQLGMAEENRELVSDILESLDLENLTDAHPMSLSGGQKQRVAIGSSILAGKEILVFDEPTSGLDYHHMVQTCDCISTLKGKKTVLIVTHDPELISRCCTHVLELHKGKVRDVYVLDDEGLEKVRRFFLV